LAELGRPTILDGEIVALDEEGHPRFEWLAQLSQLELRFRRNENSFAAKSHVMNTSVWKMGENGL